MQKENEDVIKLRKASKLATVQGIRTVTEIMKKLIHDPWIQQECTRMAWNFIFHYPKFKKIFYDYEGIETTIESIALHYKNKLYGKHIAKSGLFCIHQMATIITTKNPKMKTTLIQNIHETTVRSNVVEVAVNAMRYYPLDARLQEAGCAALGWWAFKATNRDRYNFKLKLLCFIKETNLTIFTQIIHACFDSARKHSIGGLTFLRRCTTK